MGFPSGNFRIISKDRGLCIAVVPSELSALDEFGYSHPLDEPELVVRTPSGGDDEMNRSGFDRDSISWEDRDRYVEAIPEGSP